MLGRASRRSWWGPSVTWCYLCLAEITVLCAMWPKPRPWAHPVCLTPRNLETRAPPPHRLHAGPLCWLFPLPGKLSPTSVGLPSICLLTLLPVLGLPSPLEGTWEGMVQGCVHCLSVFTLNCAWPRRDTRKTLEGMNEFLPRNSSFRSQPKCSSL